MKEITLSEIQKLLEYENEFLENNAQIRSEIKEFGYYKSCQNDLERIVMETIATSQYIQYPHGIVSVQESGPFFCRGESKIYPSSKPNWYRHIPKESRKKSIYSFVEHVRLCELFLLLDKLNAVKCFPSGTVNYSAIAQHYGFKTNNIDITNRLKVALFFACCTQDNEDQWRPLSKGDFYKDGTADGRFGVLFLRDRFTCSTSFIKPIGYQPFLRCHMQYGYLMLMDSDWDLKNINSGFDAFYFKHDKNFCKSIYDLNGGGKTIYPEKSDTIFIQLFDRIKHAKSFSKQAFDIIFNHRLEIPFSFPSSYTREQILQELCDYKINDCPIISNKEIESINKLWCHTCNNKNTCQIQIP